MAYTRATGDERALYVAIGAQIRKERIKRGLTQRVLGERSGHITSWITHLERGRIRPSLWSLVLIADVLRIPVTVLLPPECQGDTNVATLQHRVGQLEASIEIILSECKRIS